MGVSRYQKFKQKLLKAGSKFKQKFQTKFQNFKIVQGQTKISIKKFKQNFTQNFKEKNKK